MFPAASPVPSLGGSVNSGPISPPMMMAPPPPQPVDPGKLFAAQELLKKPTWDDVIGRLRNDKLRTFTIDIETDSTIVADEEAQKQSVTEFVGAIGQILSTGLPVLNEAPEFAPFFGETLKFAARRFDAGRQMEAVIEETVDKLIERTSNPAAPAPDPKLIAAQGQAQAAITKAQASIQVEQQKAQADVQLEGMKAQANMGLRQSEAQADAALEASKAQADAQVAAIKAIHQPPRGI